MKAIEIYDKTYEVLDSIRKASLLAGDLNQEYFNWRDGELTQDEEIILTASYPEAGTKNAIVLDYLQTARSAIVTIRAMLEASHDQR